jgi:hypothetical protein
VDVRADVTFDQAALRRTAAANRMQLLILTVQRTGGTSLTDALCLAMGADSAAHEPFLTPRQWGWVTLNHRENGGDNGKLLRDMQSVLAEGVIVKHCCELHDDKFNRMLIDVAGGLGYRFLVLFRESELDRLMSRIFARRTGIFFKTDLVGYRRTHDELIAHLRNTTLREIDEEIRRSATSVRSLLAAAAYLRKRGYRYLLERFEDIFEAASQQRFDNLLSDLGIVPVTDPARQQAICSILTANQQGTRPYYNELPYREKMRAAVEGAWAPLASEWPILPGWLSRLRAEAGFIRRAAMARWQRR